MQYKTLTLELLKSQPALYRRLRTTRRLMDAMETHALDLKVSHLEWIDRLTQDRPEFDPQSRKSQALELALEELTQRLVREDSQSESADVR